MRPLRLLLTSVVLLAACGQTGQLVLPDEPTATPSPTPVAITPPQVDEPAQERRRGTDAPATATP